MILEGGFFFLKKKNCVDGIGIERVTFRLFS